MTVNIGIVGLGAAGQAFIPALRAHPGFNWVALAEPVDSLRESLSKVHGVTGYADLASLLAHPGLNAVYIATPTPLHHEQVVMAANAGKHVLVEKPMATSLVQAHAMVSAAFNRRVVLLVGHSHSYDQPIARMREIITSGELGRVGMVNTWCYTDWMYRPRRPEELDVALGGGTLFRQGAHQFDVLRLLCGGKARSVRAQTFDWDPQRRSVGAHMAFVEFEDGVAASAAYNGYGGFSSTELCSDISEWGFQQKTQTSRRLPTASASVEQELKAKRERASGAIPAQAPYQPFFGLTIVSCERGDIRQSPSGLLIYSAEGRREEVLPTELSPRDAVVAEFFDAIQGKKIALHDGRWGLATLELSIAALQSAQSGKNVALHEQVAVRA